MKRFLVIVLTLLLLLSCVACGKRSQAEAEERIGIISAMDNEVALLLREAEIDHVDTDGGVDFHVGTLHGKNVVIMRSKIGKAMPPPARRPC